MSPYATRDIIATRRELRFDGYAAMPMRRYVCFIDCRAAARLPRRHASATVCYAITPIDTPAIRHDTLHTPLMKCAVMPATL